LREAIEAARKINPEDTDHVGVLTLVVPHLPVDQRPAVLTEIFATTREVDRMYRRALGPALAEIVPYVPSELCPTALELAREIWSPHALVALVSQVPSQDRQELLDEALAAVRGIAQPTERARLLAMVLPLVEVDRRLDVLQETLAAVQEISFPAHLTDLLSIFLLLTPVWTELPQQQARALWSSTVHAYATQRRTYFLTVLIGLMPVIKVLGGEDAISETMNAVLEICCQWSWV
jgi:hypothetical protein